jgi:WD40 repeat protein
LPDIVAAAWGGQYRRCALADKRGIISVRTIPDNQELLRIASDQAILGNSLYFSPDEQYLLGLAKGHSLRVWRVWDGQLALRDKPGGCRARAFSPDGRRLAVGHQEMILCFDLATGLQVNCWRLPVPAWSLAFNPDNRRLAVGSSGSSVVSVYDAASGALLLELPVGAIRNQVVAWHPDGERLAIAGSDPRIHVWNVVSRQKLATLEGHVQQITVATFHPQGDLLASYSWDGVLRLWETSTGRGLLQLPLTFADLPRFSGDGRWLGAALRGEHADLLEVTPSREYRTLVSSAQSGRGGHGQGDISPDGRLLAVGLDDGAQLWDLETGREVARLPAWSTYVFFEPRETSSLTPGGPRWNLLTCGRDGLLRWPVSRNDPGVLRFQIGPPQRLSLLRRAWFGHGHDGRTLCAVTEEGGANVILDLAKVAVQRHLGVHPSGEVRALSGDGRWAASCGWHSDRVRLWNLGTGQMVHEWVLGKQTSVCFTPDSRELIISRGDAFSFWDVETLRLIRRLPRDVTQFPGAVAFSPDGRLMAMEMAPAVIHLKEVTTGRTVAQFEDPHGDRATWQGFTPDGTRLVVVASYASAVHLWDLRAIRNRLKGMNLDWDWTEFPPPATGKMTGEPVTVEILPGELLRADQRIAERARSTIDRSRREVSATPDSAWACNSLAWAYLVAPESLRDVQAALPLAEKAVRLASENPDYCNTLGVAYYRAGRCREAVEVLRRNVNHRENRALSNDLYFLAMSHHRLGETARARDYYDWAVRWDQVQPALDAGHREEINAFRDEAERLLGIDPGRK